MDALEKIGCTKIFTDTISGSATQRLGLDEALEYVREGDTLVVDVSGFNDKTWIDSEGHPHSDALHVVERIRRTDHDHLLDEVTVDDPKAYTKTLTTRRVFDFEPEWNIAEFVCEDSDVFRNYQKEAGAEKK